MEDIKESANVVIEDRNDNFTAIPDRVITMLAKEVGPLGIAIYVTLAFHRNRKSGVSFPGIQRIADLLGITKKTVIVGIKQLEQLGVVRIERNNGFVNHYVITNQYLWKSTSVKITPVGRPVQNLHRTSVKSTLVPVQNLHPNQIELTRENNQIQDWQLKNAKYWREKSTGKRKLKVVNGKPQFLKA